MDWLQLAIAGGLAFVMLFLAVAIFGALARQSEGLEKVMKQDAPQLVRHVGALLGQIEEPAKVLTRDLPQLTERVSALAGKVEGLEKVLAQELPQLTQHADSLVGLVDDRFGKVVARLDELEARVGTALADEVGARSGEEADQGPEAAVADRDDEEQGDGGDVPADEAGHARLRSTAKRLMDRAAEVKRAGTRAAEEADQGPEAAAAAQDDEEQGDSQDAPAGPKKKGKSKDAPAEPEE
jgi:hypothetical protein